MNTEIKQNNFFDFTKEQRNKFSGMIKYANGNICYYKNDKLHNENGPAMIYNTGSKYYYLNDEFHRIGGPAYNLICYGINHEIYKYYIHGKEVTKEAHDLLYNLYKLKGWNHLINDKK